MQMWSDRGGNQWVGLTPAPRSRPPPPPQQPLLSSAFSPASRGWPWCFLSGRPGLAVLGNTGPFRGAPRPAELSEP